MSELEQRIASVLRSEASALAGRWRARADAITGTYYGRPPAPESGDAELDATLVLGMVASIAGAPRGVLDLARAGWHFGTMRCRQEVELHAALWELDLLEAIVLHAVEQSMSDAAGATASEGLRVARAIQRAAGLASRAAAKGHARTATEQQRRRFSLLRHDIRNPLGTIRNAISMLDDEELPQQFRDPQRYHRIIARNAAQAEAFVAKQLGDALVPGSAAARQEVALHDVALAVRRGLRAEADEAGVQIEVADALPVVRTDAAAVELTLLACVAGVLECGARDRVRIAPETTNGERSVRIRIEVELGDSGEAAGLTLARELAQWAGGELTLDREIVLELPASAAHAGSDLARASER